MKTKFIQLTKWPLLLSLTCGLFLCNVSIHAQKLSKKEALADLYEFEEHLFDLHPGLNYHSSEEKLRAQFQYVRDGIKDSLSISDLFYKLEPIVDSIQCGHTNIQFTNKLLKGKSDHNKKIFFPAKLVCWDNRLFLLEDYKQDWLELPKGTEILSINNQSAQEVLDTIASYNKGADGDNNYPEKLWATAAFRTIYPRFFGLKDKAVVRVRKPDTDHNDLYTFKSISYADIKAQSKKNKPDPLKLKLIPDSSLAVITYTTFSNKSLFKKSKGKIKDAFKQIKEQNIDHLIIDLRNNGGGAITNINHLLKYVLDEDFKIFTEASLNKSFDKTKVSFFAKMLVSLSKKEKTQDRIRLPGYNKKKKKPSKKHHFDGELVVLINERSYSASSLYSAIIKSRERGTLIGSVSGGSYFISFAGFSKYLKLANSKIQIRIPLIRLEYNVKESSMSKEEGLYPDIYKEAVYKDLLKRENDSVKDFAIKYLLEKEE